jgi:hypothetical protein
MGFSKNGNSGEAGNSDTSRGSTTFPGVKLLTLTLQKSPGWQSFPGLINFE